VIVEHIEQSISFHMNGASTLGWLLAFSVVDEHRLFQAPSAYLEQNTGHQPSKHSYYETRSNLTVVWCPEAPVFNCNFCH
jgi:hypothetical protein